MKRRDSFYHLLSILPILLFIPVVAYSTTITIYKASRELPLEFIYLTESIQINSPAITSDKSFLSQIKRHDACLSRLKKDEIYFLIKSEIYKNTLELSKQHNTATTPDYSILSNKPINRGDQPLPFVYWLYRAVERDINQIKKSAHFKSFLQMAKKGKFKGKLYLGWKKRLDILLPIYSFLSETSSIELNAYFHGPMKSIFNKLEKQCYIYAHFSHGLPLKSKDKKNPSLKYFAKSKIYVGSGSEDDFLDEIISKISKKIIKESGSKKREDIWRPKDHMATQKTDPNYVPPRTLPEAVDDWLDELGTNESFKRKKKVKKNSEDEWLLDY